MADVRDLVDILLLVCGSLTFLTISNKLCALPEPGDGSRADVGERAKLESAIAVFETLLTVGIKKAKFYTGYYPYLWENFLAEHPPKSRAVLLFALDAFVTSTCCLPTKLTRRLLAKKFRRGYQGRPHSFAAFMKDMIWDSCLNILLVTGIGSVVVAVSDGYGKDKERFAAICFASRVLAGVLVYLLSHHPHCTPGLQGSRSRITGSCRPVAAYTLQSALFSKVTNLAALSDYPGQTNFVQFRQSRTVAFGSKTQGCAACNRHPPDLNASGHQISGGLAVVRLVFKAYLDYVSYGNEDVSDFFGFNEEVPHPVIPMFLERYFFGSAIDTVFDMIECLLQILIWKIEKPSYPSPYDTNRIRLSSTSCSK